MCTRMSGRCVYFNLSVTKTLKSIPMDSIDKKQNIICIIDPVCRDIIIYVDSFFWSGLSGLKCHKGKLPLNYNYDMSKTKKIKQTKDRK